MRTFAAVMATVFLLLNRVCLWTSGFCFGGAVVNLARADMTQENKSTAFYVCMMGSVFLMCIAPVAAKARDDFNKEFTR